MPFVGKGCQTGLFQKDEQSHEGVWSSSLRIVCLFAPCSAATAVVLGGGDRSVWMDCSAGPVSDGYVGGVPGVRGMLFPQWRCLGEEACPVREGRVWGQPD